MIGFRQCEIRSNGARKSCHRPHEGLLVHFLDIDARGEGLVTAGDYGGADGEGPQIDARFSSLMSTCLAH
jgi:hypothetical protein